MARHLPYQTRGICIDCGNPHERESRAWRCWPCHGEVVRLCGKAVAAVNKAIDAGRLAPIDECACVDCGKPAKHYDHRDYTKPLEVEPVCHSCNLMRGPAAPIRTATPPAEPTRTAAATESA